jgi:hypothetical protein
MKSTEQPRSFAMKALAIVIGTLFVSFGALAAQTLYKSTMPDGKVIYSESPAPGAKRVDTVEPPPAKTGVTAATPQEKQRASEATAKASAAARPSPALDDARKALQKAEAARDAGKEPLAGERQGTAGGASRLSEAYFERQKSLEGAVAAARQRVQDLERR